jgi:SNF2 family DNA or RNA helicase
MDYDQTFENIISRVEYHRNAVALMPEPEDNRPGVAFLLQGSVEESYCTCSKRKTRTCPHLKMLFSTSKIQLTAGKPEAFQDCFKQSLWHDLAWLLAEGQRIELDSLSIGFFEKDGQKTLCVSDRNGETIVSYFSDERDQYRFAERIGAFPSKGGSNIPDRATVLQRLKLWTLSDTERVLNDRGLKSRRQAFEDSFWYRMGYHCFRELEEQSCTFSPSINEKTGAFVVSCKKGSGKAIFHLVVPRRCVRPLLKTFKKRLPNQHNMPIHPIPLKSIFKISQNTELDLDIRPMVKVIQKEGESRFFEREALERFIYGDLVYVKELGILAELESPKKTRKFRAPVKMTIKEHQVPSFLDDVGEEVFIKQFLVDPDVKGLKVLRTVDQVEFHPQAIDQDWCWLSINYGFGESKISLKEIIDASKEGRRYIGTPDGWVDCTAPEIDNIATVAKAYFGDLIEDGKNGLKLNRREIFRISSLTDQHPVVAGEREKTQMLKHFLDMKPLASPSLPPMASDLRQYQIAGLHWLWWLWENRLGGILCDDMGLGKTHQIMALMLCIKAALTPKRPFLVVCPTTVLSHWIIKLREHAPGLSARVYHGGDRDLDTTLTTNDVLITSYGVMRRDVEKLKHINFALAVFDEIQHIKNKATKTYAASHAISAFMKLGLTGTPIENRVVELKALIDATLPDFLGSDRDFSERYLKNDKAVYEVDRKKELRRLIFPFTLRRLKASVLKELPEKIEDIRFCTLSDHQVKLYRDAIETRAQGIVTSLKNQSEAVPYIHIFALLTLLKQICNHPAMVKKEPEAYEQYLSGKWDLFKELLQESLDSGQKVVIYSQFVEMINIIDLYLQTLDVNYVVLTGKSRNRGKLIERFNTDPACRVFVGSLKAGGTGIDLVAGSVVIHYDRWWNAAKEDQATDRVHRIGQQRGVQVFKLVTLGTLEEKISALIEKKKSLLHSIIREDDPGLIKSFSRKELVEMLTI